MKGFVFMPRALKDWEWYGDSNVTRLYIHLILKANYRDKSWQGIVIKRGQFVTSYNTLSEELCLTIQQVRTALSKLQKTGYITRKTTNKYQVLTVLKYEEYQNTESAINKKNDRQATSLKQPKHNQVTPTEEMNNIKNINKETIERRKENFKKQVFEHTQYSNEILQKFFEYWTEWNLKSGKMRFEKETFFEVAKRLVRWEKTEWSSKNVNGNQKRKLSINR